MIRRSTNPHTAIVSIGSWQWRTGFDTPECKQKKVRFTLSSSSRRGGGGGGDQVDQVGAPSCSYQGTVPEIVLHSFRMWFCGLNHIMSVTCRTCSQFTSQSCIFNCPTLSEPCVSCMRSE